MHDDEPSIHADKRTGVLRLKGTDIGPAFTRSAFLDSPLVGPSKVLVRNEPWRSFELERLPVGETELAVTLYFVGEELRAVELMDCDKIFGESWDDWSEELELRRKDRHTAWLKDVLNLPVGRYRWGQVQSVYDQRSGASTINISYGKGPSRL